MRLCIILPLIPIMLVACGKLDLVIDPNDQRPSDAEIIHFEVPVHFRGMEWTDCGVLMLPIGYNLHCADTDLIIYCHSGGGTVTRTSSECENMVYNKYLVSKGFAVLSMSAMPKQYSKMLHIDHYRTLGSEISLSCVLEGYRYVTESYHFSENRFLLSNSNGGLLASNLVHFTDISFNAQCGIAPLISIELNAWEIKAGALSGGQFDYYQNRANIISLYGMTPVSSLEELKEKKYEKDKVGDYDPFDYYMNMTDLGYPVPYMIFSCMYDQTVYYNVANTFSKEMNARGSLVLVDTTTSLGAHNVKAHPVVSGSFNYDGEVFDTNEVYSKISAFFKANR